MLAPREFHSLAAGFPISAMPTIAEIRHANLLLLVGEGHGAVKRFAARIERDPSQISQLTTQAAHSKSGQPRGMGDKMARHIETMLKLTPGWLDTPQVEAPTTGDSLPPHPQVGPDVDQLMSQSRNYADPPRFMWEELMGADLSQPFELEVVDGAFGAEIPPGCVMRLDPRRAARAGWPVLVKDRAGRYYLRDYQEGAAGRWQAVARVRGFAPLDNVDDGLQVIATMKGVDWP